MDVKRETARDVLEVIANREDTFGTPDWKKVASKHGEETTRLAVALLRDANYIRVVDDSTGAAANQLEAPSSIDSLGAARLTWSGHEVLEDLRRQEITAPVEGAYVVAGRVLDAETREALPGIRVQGVEQDPENDHVLGEVRTDRDGFYRLEYTKEHFHAAEDEEPETYIRVLDEEGNALFTSDKSYRHEAGTVAVIDAAIEGSKVSERRELGRQIRENVQAELKELRRRREDLKNRLQLRIDPLSILPSETEEDDGTTEDD